MGSTNYFGTFIQVAEDCPATEGEKPPHRGAIPTVATLQYEILVARPYELTSDDLIFEVHAIRQAIPDEKRAAARQAFFGKDQPCLRSSPLAKRYGWGIHHDSDGRVALVPINTDEYRAFGENPAVKQVKAMRSKRA